MNLTRVLTAAAMLLLLVVTVGASDAKAKG